jgi:hypothetical protein
MPLHQSTQFIRIGRQVDPVFTGYLGEGIQTQATFQMAVQLNLGQIHQVRA